ncbi:MAG: aminoacyl-tRNA hydrolase [Pirellulales bacterium]|jgi:ribosome-associated protein|nr:aminoacyl-tRNA hydrolase [Pirellulales bacterium]HCK41774.1 aminoacyl-tRNA hydrolase [Planctomycetaceae bacterium]
MPRPLIINAQIQLPAREMKLSFVRSAGPGGQNVNKVNSKAVLRWNAEQSNCLPEPIKSRFLERYAHRMTQSGEIVLASDRHREQLRNVTDCYEKLRQLIQGVVTLPRKRRASRPTRGSIERRLQRKSQLSQKKQQRQKKKWDLDS